VGILPTRVKKTRIVWLPGGEKCLRMHTTVYAKYRRVTDRRTDRHPATT